jgi:dihydrofolate reductase
MNEIDKYVVSRTLTVDDLSWRSTTLLPGDDVVGAVQRLREQDGGDLAVMGSLSLARTLISHDLVDEYRLMIEPVILGGGKRLFPGRWQGTHARTCHHLHQPNGRAHLHVPPGAEECLMSR